MLNIANPAINKKGSHKIFANEMIDFKIIPYLEK